MNPTFPVVRPDELAGLALDATEAAILLVDENARIVFANAGASRLFGHPQAAFAELPLRTLLPADMAATHDAWVKAFLNDPAPLRMGAGRQIRGRRRDGTLFDCDVGLRPFSTGGHQYVAATVFVNRGADKADPRVKPSSLRHWRRMLERVGVHFWHWNLETDSLYLSPGWLAEFDYTPADVPCGRKWFDLVHEQDRERISAAVETCLDGSEPVFVQEFRLRRKDGIVRWIRSRACIVETGAAGEPVSMAGVYADVTAERDAQERLAASERRWKFALDGAGAGVWDWNLESGEVVFSPQWKRMLGYGDDELEPDIETWRSVAHPEDLARSDALIEQYVSGEIDQYHCECRVFVRDGGMKWILDRGLIVERDEAGRPTRMIGTHEDITRAKQHESEIIESRDRLERIARLVPGMVYRATRSNDGRYFFSWISPSVETLFGVTVEAALADSRCVFDRIHPDDRTAVFASVDESATLLTPWFMEFRAIVGGRARWLEAHADPVRDADGVTWHGHIADIEARVQARDALRKRSQLLEVINEDLEQFNYIVSHDLKEPLRGIRHLAEWIAEDLGAAAPSEVTRNLGRLQERVNRLQSLIEDLSHYARAARSDDIVSEVDVRELLEQLRDEIARSDSQLDLGAVEPALIETSDVALRTVLRNLISNAFAHHDHPDGARVEVESRRVEHGWLFAVTDNGPGIAAQHHQRIFRIYQRLNPERNSGGTGTGLAIVKRILDQLGSSVAVHSPLTDRGSRFEFVWPETWPRRDQANETDG